MATFVETQCKCSRCIVLSCAVYLSHVSSCAVYCCSTGTRDATTVDDPDPPAGRHIPRGVLGVRPGEQSSGARGVVT